MTKARTLADNFAADINGITAGTGISGGGTSGTVTVTNSMATTIDTKGDLVVGTGADTFDKLAAGSNGDTLVADSSTSTGLRYNANFAAGKNKIINGDFRINQRNFTSTTTNAYGFDRFSTVFSDGTSTYSAETFTPGAAPVAGYEGSNFARIVSTGQTLTSAGTRLQQFIESVRTFAGQTVTVSFYAKAGSGTPSVACYFEQRFGTGGSPSSTVTINGQKAAITTSWARYSFTFSIPSISGKTLGTTNDDNLRFLIMTSAGSDFNARTDSLGIQSVTIDLWGVQVEAGSVATAFQTATGTLQGELAACQRYYYRQTSTDDIYSRFAMGSATATTNGQFLFNFPVQMRVKPSSLDISAASTFVLWDGVNDNNVTAISGMNRQSVNNASVDFTTAATLTQFRPYWTISRNTTSAFVGFSAEL
jgi:Carbohydrate binding domain